MKISKTAADILDKAGIDPASVTGTGNGGAITVSDAKAAAAGVDPDTDEEEPFQSLESPQAAAWLKQKRCTDAGDYIEIPAMWLRNGLPTAVVKALQDSETAVYAK